MISGKLLIPSKEELQKILSLIDLTSLEGKDNQKSTEALCEKAIRYQTASVCVYPTLVSAAKMVLKGSAVKVASVAGAFPSGQLPLILKLEEIKFAIEQGADEIDAVISRGKILERDYKFVAEEIAAYKKICTGIILKVILETGELITHENITIASKIAIENGADFIKTSTGKITTGATSEAIHSMLNEIKRSGKLIGIKPSGGISTIHDAIHYIQLTKTTLGKDWIKPSHFRIGATRLADVIFTAMKKE